MIEQTDMDINAPIVSILHMFKKVDRNMNVRRRDMKLLVVKNIIS